MPLELSLGGADGIRSSLPAVFGMYALATMSRVGPILKDAALRDKMLVRLSGQYR